MYSENEDVYEMCNDFLDELSYLDAQLENRKSHHSGLEDY